MCALNANGVHVGLGEGVGVVQGHLCVRGGCVCVCVCMVGGLGCVLALSGGCGCVERSKKPKSISQKRPDSEALSICRWRILAYP